MSPVSGLPTLLTSARQTQSSTSLFEDRKLAAPGKVLPELPCTPTALGVAGTRVPMIHGQDTPLNRLASKSKKSPNHGLNSTPVVNWLTSLRNCSSQGSLKKSSRWRSESLSAGRTSTTHMKSHDHSSKQLSQCGAPRKLSRGSSEPLLMSRRDSSSALGDTSGMLHHACTWPVSKRKSRHQAAIERSQQLDMSVSTMFGRDGRNVALIRMVYSEARRRHQDRPSFQRRRAELDMQNNDLALPFKKEPTIWRLHQLRDILFETVQDVVLAVKSCRGASAFLHKVHEQSMNHKQQDARDCLDLQRRTQEKDMRMKSAWKVLTAGLAARHASDDKDAIKRAQWDCETEWQCLRSTLDK